MSNQVQCIRCNSQVPLAQTTFTAAGEYLCQRCTSSVDLEQQVERARQEGLDKANSKSGLIQRLFARWAAKKEHDALIAEIEQTTTLASCMSCGRTAQHGFVLCAECQAKVG